ncbi:hypothetical protein AB0B28_02285 [Glycomyces sp. NPDC046736]|uniref:hypothetical protein n=1 Tax=Glycomyces sp. NPDC046736 TaxID=3155615 RepID=UPI0033DEA483
MNKHAATVPAAFPPVGATATRVAGSPPVSEYAAMPRTAAAPYVSKHDTTSCAVEPPAHSPFAAAHVGETARARAARAHVERTSQ